MTNKEMVKLRETEVCKYIDIIVNDKLVGYAQVSCPEMILNNFIIFDEYQNRGYGKLAVKLLVEQYGVKKLWVKCDNEKAKHVYESCGFERAEYTTHFLMELKRDEFCDQSWIGGLKNERNTI